MNEFGRSQRMGEFSAPFPQDPESADQPDELDLDAIAQSLMAAPVGEDERLVLRSWGTIEVGGLVEVPGVGARHGSAKISIDGTEFEANLEPADAGGLRVEGEISGMDVPPGVHQVVVEVIDEHGAKGRATLGRLRVVDPSRPSTTDGRSRASTSSSGSAFATADENDIFGLSRAQAAVGAAGVGIAGAVLAALL